MPIDETKKTWEADALRNPHVLADKADRVRAMFGAIAHRYDLNNRLHTLWRDQAWRRAAVRLAHVQPREIILDAACGTGDLSLAFVKRSAAQRVIGIDFTPEMLDIARTKAERAGVDNVTWQVGDVTQLPLAGGSVDVVSIAFGIRNVADPPRAIAEFYRVLRPGGRLIVLEFSMPSSKFWRGLYHFYFHHVLPRTAALIAGDRTGAYKYLPCSVDSFIDRPQMLSMIDQAGFTDTAAHPLTLGIAVAYRGVKAFSD